MWHDVEREELEDVERDIMAHVNMNTEMPQAPKNPSSVYINLDESFRQLDQLVENIEYLNVRLSDVLTPMPGKPTSSDDSVEASSNLGSKINAIAYRLQEYNQRLAYLAASVDL